jgi:hypothetical protein
MQLSNFELAVQSHLHFLIDDVKYKTGIEIVRDRGQALISLGAEGLDRWDWIEFAEAINFLSGKSEPVYLFSSLDTPLSDDAQVSHLSMLLHAYCEQLLTGKMSIVQLRDAIRTRRTQGT